jgi:dUTP pyrophosphatase
MSEFYFCLDEQLAEKCKLYNEQCLEDTKISPGDFLPKRADDLSAGWDVRCAETTELIPFRYLKIPLGFKVFVPDGWFLKLVPRSSTFIKRHIHSLYGTIDESYEGMCYYCCQYVPDNDDIIMANSFKEIKFGERIAQIIPEIRYNISCRIASSEKFATLCSERNATRGSGGFGSSGIK